MNIQDLAKEKWKSSGLTDNEAKKLKILPLPDAKKLHNSFHPVGALKIPYFDTNGKTTEFYRIRYLQSLPGFLGSVAKPQRYAQAPGTLNEVYLPPLLPVAWDDVLDDPKVVLHITEGEFKAAAACAKGFACIGLGGVDVWRSSKRGLELLPLLQKIVWKDRVVVILYDSDAATNSNVVRAQRQLAKELLNQGARPIIASLPPTADGGKQGLDDFLVSSDREGLLKIIEEAQPFDEAEALWEMNEEVVYVMDPGIVIHQTTGQKMAPANFIKHHFSTRTFLERSENSEGKTKIAVKSTAERWVKWPSRFELKKAVYEPGKPRVVDNQWNLWKGWGCEPKKGDIGPWKKLLDFLFKSAPPDARKWFEQWCAYPIQHPGEKLYTSTAVWGTNQGTGKTFIGYILMKIYGENGVEIDDSSLRGNFNSWAANKQFICGDEVTGNEKKAEADKLKRLITRENVIINAKFVPEYQVRDCTNYYFTSNHPDAFFLEDTDRRFFIHEVVGGPGPRAMYDEIDAWSKGDGPSALFHHLLTLDLKGFHPRGHAPMTSSKSQMIVDGKSDLGMWCRGLREDIEGTLCLLNPAAAKSCDLFTATQLFKCYDPEGRGRVTVNGLSRELKKNGFRKAHNGDPVMTKNMGTQRLFILRNDDRWVGASPKQLADHFEKFFGAKSKRF